jgi:hypothetical protein
MKRLKSFPWKITIKKRSKIQYALRNNAVVVLEEVVNAVANAARAKNSPKKV